MSVVFSCVTDGTPKYDYQALVWATTLLRCANRLPDEVVVHTAGGTSELLREIAGLGVEVARQCTLAPPTSTL
jgi:hypothetical protein